mmetsp:Transcript_63301/g.183373  ORF Transcript_63301/g.183373 Transcript_63301/m.183373 type:complete len:266 (+) Transcript_63301:108-905(+)|eukprot:CAMPEP_0170317904 /NCGR_PEP_ID=MMETSP0116_2-20130129/59631_1 /TAXON_ID=400756 /ORGANISM="Durinskia baltica, Strain CSIRO CS-38" /LENGTH=265 /DNA_ID=CAMNT_0010570565 /DNA_START=105 /DNA_END=902 /DNA_ORIENTATION=-
MAPPRRLQSALQAKRGQVEQSIQASGRRVIASESGVFLVSLIVAVFGCFAHRGTGEMCESTPIRLRSWFTGIIVSHIIAALVFLLISGIVISLLNEQAKLRSRSRGAGAASEDLPVPEPPAPTPATAPDSPTPGPQAPPGPPAPPPNPGPSDNDVVVDTMLAGGLCRLLFLLVLLAVVVADCLFVATWAAVGLVTAIGAMLDDDLKHICSDGLVYFWILVGFAVLNCLFKIFAGCCAHGCCHTRAEPREQDASVGDMEAGQARQR